MTSIPEPRVVNLPSPVIESEKIVGNITELKKPTSRIDHIAISPDDSTNSEDILKFSDIAMYAAKSDKDTNYRFFDKAMLKRESDAEHTNI